MSPSRERVAEVWVSQSGRVGSGYLLTSRLLLTARHVVEAAIPSKSPPVPPTNRDPRDWARVLGRPAEPCQVRPLSDGDAYVHDAAPHAWCDAVPVWWHPDRDVDVALLLVVEPTWEPPLPASITWARLDDAEPVACTAVGFPDADVVVEGEDRVRDSRQITGLIPPLALVKSNRLAVHVDGMIGTADGDESAWSGMSGAALFTRSTGVLLGVIAADSDATDRTRRELRAQPASQFADVPQFVTWLAWDAGFRAWQPTTLRTTRADRLKVKVPPQRDGGLVGRDRLVNEARNRLLGDRDLAFLSGLPGAGKTALAIAVGNDAVLAQQFEDGCLWLGVGREDDSGLQHWVHRMAEWAHVLGASTDAVEQARSDEDAERMSKLVSDALGWRRCLLVFDDVWKPEDALLFKDIGVNCRRVLTTRIPDVANDFTQPAIEVTELEAGPARALLEQYCPDAGQLFGNGLDRVLVVVSGLPLGLVLVGMNLQKRLSKYGQEDAAGFLDEIMDVNARLRLEGSLSEGQHTLGVESSHITLQAVIGLTADHLESGQLRALQSLTAFPPKANTFTRRAGEYVIGAAGYFEDLTEVGLVELNDRMTSRFTLHQAIVDFARQGSAGDKLAYRRMAEYFLRFIEEKSRGDDSNSWVDLLQWEGENLRTALDSTLRNGETALAMRLMAALWPYWYERSYFQRARDLAARVLALPMPSSPSVEDQLMRAKLLNDAGNFAYNMSDLDQAEQLHREALGMRSALGAEDLTAGSWNNLGLVLRERGLYAEALEHFTRAIEINERTQHGLWRPWMAMNLNNLGVTHFRQGAFAQARDEQLRAIDLFEELGSAWGVAMVRTDLAEAQIRLAETAVARELLQQVLPGRWGSRDDKAVAAVLRAWATLDLEQEPERAVTRLVAAVALSAPLSDRLGQGRSLEVLVLAAAAARDHDLVGRASGALDAYRAHTGVRTAPWLDEQIRRTQLTAELSDGELTARHPTAREIAAGGLVGIAAALGGSDTDLRVEDIVEDVLRVPALAV
jgi:tetratricopeptide (TPR) repeat protein